MMHKGRHQNQHCAIESLSKMPALHNLANIEGVKCLHFLSTIMNERASICYPLVCFALTFKFIHSQTKEAITDGIPAISVDTKKKENIGNFKNDGTEYRACGSPRQVSDHDFLY